MRVRIPFIVVFALPLLPSATILGQEFGRVTLKDGSIVVGEVEDMVDGKLKVKTAFGIDEIVTVKWSEVINLKTTKALPFVLSDGSTIVGVAEEGQDGKLVIRSEQLVEAATVAITSVSAINPPEKKAVTYSGNVNFGGSVLDGNTQTKSASFLSNFVARSEKQRLTMKAAWNYAEDSDGLIARNTKGSIKYDYFITERLFAFVSALFEEDKFQDLNLRTALSGGPGYQFVEKGDLEEDWLSGLEFYGEAGLAFFDEDFRRGEDQRFLSARWSIKVDWPVAPKVTLFHYHEGFPGLEDLSDLYISTETGARFNIWENFIATLQFNWRWDNTPSPGFERTDTQYLLSLGYNFSF